MGAASFGPEPKRAMRVGECAWLHFLAARRFLRGIAVDRRYAALHDLFSGGDSGRNSKKQQRTQADNQPTFWERHDPPSSTPPSPNDESPARFPTHAAVVDGNMNPPRPTFRRARLVFAKRRTGRLFFAERRIKHRPWSVEGCGGVYGQTSRDYRRRRQGRRRQDHHYAHVARLFQRAEGEGARVRYRVPEGNARAVSSRRNRSGGRQ